MVANSFAVLIALTLAGPVGISGRLHDLDGRVVDPFTPSKSAYVFVFVRTDCPISNRYAPELVRLDERFASRGVTFALVYSGDQTGPDAIRAHVREYRYPFAALRDPDFSFVDSVGATVTPEVAVFDLHRTLRYVGRIDDRYISAGHMRPRATRHDLADAIEAVLAGTQVESTRTAAVGCLIADIR